MSIMLDLKELLWKDNDDGSLNKITELKTYGNVNVVWYMDVESLDEHCMSVDIFVSKHTASGLFNDLEHV